MHLPRHGEFFQCFAHPFIVSLYYAVLLNLQWCFSLYLVQVSITFDPFSIIQVPIPKEKKLIRVIFMSTIPSNRPIKVKTLHV